MKSKIQTLLLDLDGCVFYEPSEDKIYHFGAILSGEIKPIVSAKVKAFLSEWVHVGHKLIFTTGRSECFRSITEKQLAENGISYDQLVMDAGTGIRIVVNNTSSVDESSRAEAVSIEANGDFITPLKKYLND